MSVRISKSGEHVQYGIVIYTADNNNDIQSLPTTCTPGSECFCIETSTTYILNNQGEWKVKSKGGGGPSPSYQEKSITPDFSNGNVSVTADSKYDALSEVTVQKDATLLAENIKKNVTVHGVTGSYEGGGSSDATKLKSYLERTVTTIDDDILESIGNYVFMNYISPSLESVSFSEVTTIGTQAFSGCTGLKSVSFPEATTMGDYAFYNNTRLTNANFSKATTISANAFYGCTSLTSIILRNASKVTLANVNAFFSTPFVDEVTTATLYVPQALISDYQNDSKWSQILAHNGTTIAAIEGSPYENA